MLDQATAMGYEICNSDDDMGQSMLEAKVWRKATLTEQLVGDVNIQRNKKTLKTAASITIATWLEEIHELRQRIQCGKTVSKVMGVKDPETLPEADEQF